MVDSFVALVSLKLQRLVLALLASTFIVLGGCGGDSVISAPGGVGVSSAPEVVAERDSCPDGDCYVIAQDGELRALAEVADAAGLEDTAERWGYDPGELPVPSEDQFLLFVAAEVALNCEVTPTKVVQNMATVVLTYERLRDADVCLDSANATSAVLLLTGNRPAEVKTVGGSSFEFVR